jgi:hypothetical protein
MLNVLNINPVGSDLFDKGTLETPKKVKSPQVRAKVVHLSKGP